MNEIALIEIDNLNDLNDLNDFIDATNDKAMTVKGLVVASDGDIKRISADTKEMKQREDVLEIAKERLIKLAGIDMVGFTIENSRKQRLLANKNVQNAKQKIKDDAINYFVENATQLISKSQANVAYKASFDLNKMALETIAGRSKDFMALMKTELGNVRLRLDNNARETSERLAIINKYDVEIVRDSESLLRMPVDLLSQTLENRKYEQEKKFKYEAQKLADAIEAERLAAIEADKIEAERLAKIEADKIEAERLAAIEAENKKGDWYCPNCQSNVDVNYNENCSHCNLAVVWVEESHVAVPITLIQSVSRIGYGVAELDKKWVNMARNILNIR